MDTPTLEILAERIAGLEQQNRWLKRLGGAAVVGLLALVSLGTNAVRGPREIAAEKFVLNDTFGKPRAKLEMTLDGPSLSLLNRDGKDQAVLRTWEDGTSALNFLQGKDHSVALSHSPSFGPSLNLVDRNRQSRASMFVDSDGGSGLSLHRYQWGVGMGMETDGTSKLKFLDRTGLELAGMAVAPEGDVLAIGRHAGHPTSLSEAHPVRAEDEENAEIEDRAESGCRPTAEEDEASPRLARRMRAGAATGRQPFLAP